MTRHDDQIKAVYFSRFMPVGNGDGGARRTYQIYNALKGMDIDFISSFGERENAQSLPYSWKQVGPLGGYIAPLVRAYYTNGCYSKWSESRRDELLYQSYISNHWHKRIAGKHYHVAIVDDPIYFTPILRRLKALHVPTVALCHNIETLSKPQVIGKYQLRLLSGELSLFTLCDLVVTISREETFLFSNLGINTHFLPYFPAENIARRMSEIRELRQSSDKEGFLMVGTAGNLPTLEGMKRLLESWRETCRGRCLTVCGFGTEQLKTYEELPMIKVEGSVSDDELDHLLAHTRGTVVYQQEGSGALTKIAELLLAGVPVLANSHAARTYYNVPGVVEFRTLEQLPICIDLLEASQGTFAPYLLPDSSGLVDSIRAVAR